ncbi:MAG: hypothetical protein LH481_12150 [Burkholderiales bacterium]|nr:hypothetical protein [Burkholderiales bacterium]
MTLSGELMFSGLLYLLCVAVTACLHMREARDSPEKGIRYRALPRRYKALCYFGVLPLFAAMPIFEGSFLLAIVAFAATEGLCVRWYRRNGFL